MQSHRYIGIQPKIMESKATVTVTTQRHCLRKVYDVLLVRPSWVQRYQEIRCGYLEGRFFWRCSLLAISVKIVENLDKILESKSQHRRWPKVNIVLPITKIEDDVKKDTLKFENGLPAKIVVKKNVPEGIGTRWRMFWILGEKVKKTLQKMDNVEIRENSIFLPK